MLPIEEIVIRLLIAAFLGGIIGFEREKHSQPAGLRTHIILTLGAAIAMCLSINISAQYKGITANGDPERIAAQVVSGIGFLGAGAIFRYGATVKGLTTAASLWTMAMVGLAVGAGYYWLSAFATLLVIATLIILDIIEKRFVNATQTHRVSIRGQDRPGFIMEIKGLFRDFDFGIKTIEIEKTLSRNEIEILTLVKAHPISDFDTLIGKFSKVEGIISFKVH
ncbi:MgtC/SapB family protein [Bdellovibrionota bacterium FG-2]